MLKEKELSEPNSCINKARDEEPVFVLLGRDASAPVAVRLWATRRVEKGKNKWDDPQIVEAYELAAQMDRYRIHGPIKEVKVIPAEEPKAIYPKDHILLTHTARLINDNKS